MKSLTKLQRCGRVRYQISDEDYQAYKHIAHDSENAAKFTTKIEGTQEFTGVDIAS